MHRITVDNYLLNMRNAVKEMAHKGNECELIEQQEKEKATLALEKGSMEEARKNAENAIRQRHLALNYLRMSARIATVVARVDKAHNEGKLTYPLLTAVRAIDAALRRTNVPRLLTLVGKFEKLYAIAPEAGDAECDALLERQALADVAPMPPVPPEEVDQLLQQLIYKSHQQHNENVPNIAGSLVLPPPLISAAEAFAQERAQHLKRLEGLRQALREAEAESEWM